MQVIFAYWLVTTSPDTVADPRPELMWEPVLLYCNSSPRYRIEVISQLFRSTVTTSELDDPASTTKLLPLLIRPNAAEADGEKSATATARILGASMVKVVGGGPEIKGSRRLGQTLLCIEDDNPRKNICANDGRQSFIDQDDYVQT